MRKVEIIQHPAIRCPYTGSIRPVVKCEDCDAYGGKVDSPRTPPAIICKIDEF